MDAFIGEIRAFPYGYVPEGWFSCSGQLIQIAEWSTLFSIIGTTYGGNGRSTFALPDLSDSLPNGMGTMPGGEYYPLGREGGAQTVTLTVATLPKHRHQLIGASIKGVVGKLVTTPIPNTCYLSNAIFEPTTAPVGGKAYANDYNTTMNAHSISTEGQSVGHENMMPFSVFRYCICWNGEYPRRS